MNPDATMMSEDRGALHIAFVGEGDAEDAGVAGANSPAMLIRALRQAGHRVTAVDCEVYGARRGLVAAMTWSANRERWTGRYHLHPRAHAARTRHARRGLAAIAGRLDAVIQYGSAFDATLPGVPTFIWCDTCATVTRNEPFSWMTALSPREQDVVAAREGALFRRVAGVLPWSRYAGDRIAAVTGAPADRVHVTYVGPSLELGRAAAERRSWQGPTVRVLFVGREFARKGGDLLLDAVASLRADRHDVRVTLVGPSSLPAAPDFVDFLGFLDKSRPADVERLVDAYRDADIFCLPTRREPFGIAVAEAMLARLPVVATSLSAIPEMVEEGTTGYLVNVDDRAALVDGLRRLVTDAGLRERMGEAGLSRARARFSWGAVAASVVDAIRTAVPA